MMNKNMLKNTLYATIFTYALGAFAGCAKEPTKQDISDQVQVPKKGEKIKSLEEPLEDVSQIKKKAYSLYMNSQLSDAKEGAINGYGSDMFTGIEEAEDAAIRLGEDISERVNEIYKIFIEVRLSDAEGSAKGGDGFATSGGIKGAEYVAEKAGLDILERVKDICWTYVNSDLSDAEKCAKEGNRSIMNVYIRHVGEFAEDYVTYISKKKVLEDIKRIRDILDSNPGVELDYLEKKKIEYTDVLYKAAEESSVVFESYLEDLEKTEAQILELEKKIAEKK